MGSSTTSNKFSMVWAVAIVLVVCGAIVATVSTYRSSATPAAFDVQLSWPQALSLSEPTPVLGFIEDHGKEPFFPGKATLYALFEVDQGRQALIDAMDKEGEAERIELGQSKIVDGMIELSIPPLSRFSALDEQTSKNVKLVIHVRRGGQDVYIGNDFSLRGSKPALALTLDRPLYQPGQTMLMRAVVVDSVQGTPLKEADLHWTMHDPQGNLVFDLNNQSSRAGVATAEYELASQGQQGDYKISVAVDGVRAEQVVSVLPFRLPRFSVNVEPGKPSMDSGEVLSWRVEARYIHGESVVGAKVKTTLSWRTWDEPKSTVIEGVTGEDGIFRSEWQAPGDLRPGSRVSLHSVVTTEAGRAEEASSSLAVAGSRPKVSIYPVGRAHFVQGQLSPAIALVTDERGSPLADQALSVVVPEEPRRTLELRTDAAGRASFEWTPRQVGAFAEQVRIEARLPDHPMSMQNIDVPLRTALHYLKASSPAARAGEPFEFVMQPHQGTLFLTLATERGPLTTQVLQPSPEAYKHEVIFPSIARGLSKIVISSRDRVLDELPVWVRQETTSEVLVAPEAPGYEPGEIAWVDLSFPVLEKSNDEPPVTFGLLGVDEALYALKERADVPWEILLRQAPEVMTSILPLLEGLEEEDEMGRQIATARFLAELESRTFGEGLSLSGSAGDDISLVMAERSVEGRGQGLAFFFIFCLYMVLALVWRVTLRTLDLSMFTFRSAGVILAVTFAATVGWLIIVFTLDFEGILIFYALGLTALLFVLGVTIPEESQLPAFLWLLASVGIIALIGCVAFLLGEYHPSLSIDKGGMFVALLIVPMGSILLTAGAWVFILLARDEPMPASMLAGLVGPIALLLLAVPLFGRTVESKFSDANSVVVSELSFGEAADGRAPSSPPPPSTRPEPAPSLQLLETARGGGGSGVGDRINRTRQARGVAPTAAPRSAARADGADMPMIELIGGTGREGAPEEEAAEPAAGRAPAPEGTVRSWFPETMVWMPELDSDPEGNLRVSFPVPDSMTSWRLDAYAHSRDGRFGQGQAGLLVTRHFFVELDLPTHLTDGDRLEVPATLVNNTDEVLKARIEATTEGALEVEPLNQRQIEVAPRNRHVFTLSLRAQGVGKGELTVSAYGEESQLLDGERREATVAPHGRLISETVSGTILDGARQEFTIPEEAITNTPALDVTILPGKVSNALDGLEGMLRMPNGCFEQTSSINYPNTLVLQMLKQTDPSLWPGGADVWKQADEKARGLLHLGYQRMLTFQDGEGGFALYPRARPELLLTAYGVVQLLDMSKVHNVDEKVVLRSVEWLARRQGGDGSWSPDGYRRYSRGIDDQIRATALVSMGMLRATSAPYYGPATDKALDYLERQSTLITSDHTLALVANALLLGKREDAARRAMDRLAERVVGADDLGYLAETGQTWMGGHGQYARIETTAMAVNAFLIAGVHQPMWKPMLNYLGANRASWGGWGTTQATVWALTALQQTQAAPGRTEILVRLGGEPMAHAQGDARPGQMIIDSEIALMQTFREEGVSAGPAMMTIASTDTTPAMYRATAEYAVPWNSPLAADETGIAVSLDVPDRRMAIHTNQTLTARLKNTSDRRMDTLIAELPLPPGAFISRDQFETLVEKGSIDHFEILPTHARIYLAGINAQQTLTLEYTFATMLRGEMNLPPLRAYQFYTPRPLYEVNGGGVVVP